MMTLHDPPDCRSSYHGVVIAIVGPPHSGKSIFLAELYRQMLQRQPSGVFLQRACPDGEGMWSNEADPAIVRQIRKKSAFSEEFSLVTLQGIERLGRNRHHNIVLLDLGGKRTAENAEILRRSTHCIILSSQREEIPAWQTFATAEGCHILAILHSQLVYQSCEQIQIKLDLTARSTLQTDTTPMHGTLVNLCRDFGTECYCNAISSLADVLLTRYYSYQFGS
jgi:CRISPR-associated protein Csx3